MSLKVHAPQAGGGLLERDEQFATLFEALSDARIGRGRVVFVAGEAGAGKTSLARILAKSTEALRTGTYDKTLTFTLSTDQP